MALFTLSKPIKFVLSGVHGPRREEVITEINFRSITANDLRLMEQFKGQPATLMLHATAAFSGLTVAQVKKIDIDDYAIIARDAMEALAQACRRAGMRPEFFVPKEALE